MEESDGNVDAGSADDARRERSSRARSGVTLERAAPRAPARSRYENPIAKWAARLLCLALAPALYLLGATWWLLMVANATFGGASNAYGSVVAARGARHLFRLARRLWPRDVSFNANLPTVLYLRSFSEDNRRIEYAVHADATDLTTIEEMLARVVDGRANFLAFGDPLRLLPPIGPELVRAGRTWKRDVKEWMRTAECIIVAPGTTPGLSWELDYAFKKNILPKCYFIFPMIRGGMFSGRQADEHAMSQRWTLFLKRVEAVELDVVADKETRERRNAIEEGLAIETALPSALWSSSVVGASFLNGKLLCDYAHGSARDTVYWSSLKGFIHRALTRG
jgi:hypothetical protein